MVVPPNPPGRIYEDIEPGEEAPSIVNAIVEIAKGHRNKYEVDKKTGLPGGWQNPNQGCRSDRTGAKIGNVV